MSHDKQRIRSRDAGLHRVRQLTVFLGAGGVVMAGGFSVLAERSFSGQHAVSAPVTDPGYDASIVTDGVDPAATLPPEVQTVPAQTVPAPAVPVATVPAPVLPVETVPAQTVPAQAVPVQTAPPQPVETVATLPPTTVAPRVITPPTTAPAAPKPRKRRTAPPVTTGGS